MTSNPRETQSSQPVGTYNVHQSHPLASAAYEASELHLRAAALYMTTLLDNHGVSNALMGGFSMFLRGSSRVTHDIDVAVGCDMQTILQALSPEKRVVRPLGPVSGVMRVYVEVGGDYEPSISSLHVSVDLILQGSLGAPLDPLASSELVSHASPITNTTTQYRIINIPAIIRAKLGAFFFRASQNDYQDIIFLLMRYPQEIYECRAGLNQEHRRSFVEQYAARGAAQGKLKAAKHILGVL